MEGAPDIIALNEEIKNESAFVDLLKSELGKVIVGQEGMVEGLLIGLLANGHILLEGVPGLAKTLAINSLSQTLGGSFSRVQFTPDLLPSDVIGTQIYNMKDHAFETKQGPYSATLCWPTRSTVPLPRCRVPCLKLCKSAKSPSARKLPAAQTLPSHGHPKPGGTRRNLPAAEAQMDRFLLKVQLGYPKKEEEREIMRRQMGEGFAALHAVVSLEQILHARQFIDKIYMDEKIETYILDIVFATRAPQEYKMGDLVNKISFGASPRGSIALAKAARCHAFLRHRGFVTPEDVRAVAPAVLRHRIGLTYEAEAEEMTTEDIVSTVLNTLMVP
jgi:MoxR-like ATPase